MKRRHERPLRRVNPSGRTVWVARWTDQQGRRHTAGTFPLQKQAQAAIDAAYDREAAGGSVEDSTVREYAKRWLREHPRSTRTDKTNEHRLSRVMEVKIEGRRLGDWTFAQLRPRHANSLLDHMLREQGRSATGAKNILLTLSAMATDARKDDIIVGNPFQGIGARANDPRVQKASRVPRVLAFADMHRLAAAAGTGEVMVRVAADCGLRLAELLGLYRADLKLGQTCDEPDWPRSTGPCEVAGPHLHVRRTAYEGAVTLLTKREKLTGIDTGGRVVPIPAALEPLLRAMPRRIDTLLLFPTPNGRVWWADNFRADVWTPARRASGVEATPQDFRHSWITILRAAGVDAADLAQMAGHSVEVASARYTHALGQSYDAVRAAVAG